MGITGRSRNSVSIFCLASSLPTRKNESRFWITMAKKNKFEENSKSTQQPLFPLRVSKSILARTAIGVFGLGFIDAGYSGDWSRIGVITQQTEELLKLAAFLVVPLCIFLIVYFPSESKS